jgi:hypothetical protein
MMPRSLLRLALVSLAIGALFASTLAEAQWVFLARKAVGRVEQMQQSQPNGMVSYDSAAVMFEAPADKVYATVVRLVRARQDITITREDAGAGLIQFTNGQQIAGIKVSALADNLSHLLVSSAHSGSQPDAVALVSENVLRVCREMNVECSRADQ